jgi:predicted nucleic acid-binding protein
VTVFPLDRANEALLGPEERCHRPLPELPVTRFQVAVSVPLALEYEAVLLRHAAELGVAPAEAVGVVNYLCQVAHHQEVHFIWRPALTDPGDEFILELAVAARCAAIVTHNVRDFKGAKPFGVQVLTPGQFLLLIEEEA